MMTARSCWSFPSPKPFSTTPANPPQNIDAGNTAGAHLFLLPDAALPADVSDCASMRKYRRLMLRKATGAWVLARARIRASIRGRTHMIYSAARQALLAGTFIGALTVGAGAHKHPADSSNMAPAAAAPMAPAAAPMAPAAAAPAAPATVAQAPAPAAAPALPPGSPLIGRPDGDAAAKLAPVVGPPIAAAADKLPTAKLKLPPGFNIEVYAAGMANARSLAEGDKGTVFVGSRLVDKVYGIVNKDGKRSVKVIASGLYRPNGVAFRNGTLYIAELSKIDKIDKVEDNLDNPPKPTTIYDKLPKDEAHGWKFIAIGPDNKLYVPVGQPGNNVLHDDAHGQIRRMNLDGTSAEVVALGVRNSVGFDWNPENKQMYFTDNGRDWMSEDVPEDELNRVTKVGEDFGAPYCYQGNIVDQ